MADFYLHIRVHCITSRCKQDKTNEAMQGESRSRSRCGGHLDCSLQCIQVKGSRWR